MNTMVFHGARRQLKHKYNMCQRLDQHNDNINGRTDVLLNYRSGGDTDDLHGGGLKLRRVHHEGINIVGSSKQR